MKKILISLITLVVIVAGYTYSRNNTPAEVASTKDVNLGAVLALTGYAVNEGTQMKNGIELARADLKKQGITLNVDYFDDGTDPKKTAEGIMLMHSKDIKTIFGPTWSFQVTAGIPILEKYNMLAFSSDESSDIIEDQSGTKNVLYGMPASSKVEGPTTEWLKKNSVKKVAIMFSNSGYGQVHADAWATAARLAGAEVILSEKIDYANESTVVPTLVLKAKSQGVEAILWTGGETGIITLIKKMNELGYTIPVIGTEGVHNVVRAGKAEQGSLKLYSLENTVSEEFVNKYKEMFSAEPQAYAQAAYDHTMIAVQAELNKGTATTRDYVVANPHKGYAGTYDFDERGDIASGEWKVVEVK